MKAPSPFVQTMMKYTDPKSGQRSIALGKGTCTVDALPEDAAAWWFMYTSRERMKKNREDRGLARLAVSQQSTWDQTVAVQKWMPFPLYKREFVLRVMGFTETDTGSVVICIESVPNEVQVDYGTPQRSVRGKVQCVIRLAPLQVQGCGDQCTATLLVYLDGGGYIGGKNARLMIPASVRALDELREVFQRDEELDQVNYSKLAIAFREYRDNDRVSTTTDEQNTPTRANALLLLGPPPPPPHPPPPPSNLILPFCSVVRPLQYLAPAHLEHIKHVEEKIRAHEFDSVDYKNLKSPDPHVAMSMSLVGGSTLGVLKGSVVIDATLEAVAAFEIDKTNRQALRNDSLSALERTQLHLDERADLYQVVYDLNIPTFKHREWVCQQVWRWKDADTLEFFQGSVELPEFPIRDK
jgi:hypothetical protein